MLKERPFSDKRGGAPEEWHQRLSSDLYTCVTYKKHPHTYKKKKMGEWQEEGRKGGRKEGKEGGKNEGENERINE